VISIEVAYEEGVAFIVKTVAVAKVEGSNTPDKEDIKEAYLFVTFCN
jgi:hypothetical protein